MELATVEDALKDFRKLLVENRTFGSIKTLSFQGLDSYDIGIMLLYTCNSHTV